MGRKIVILIVGVGRENEDALAAQCPKASLCDQFWRVNDISTHAVITIVVNAFHIGFGGSNSAIILEEAPPVSHRLTNGTGLTNGVSHKDDAMTSNGTTVARQNGDTTHNHVDGNSLKRLYVLSAKSESSLTAYLGAFTEFLEAASGSSAFMKDLSFTLGQRRTHHPYRVAASADSVASLKAQLVTTKPRKIRDRTIAFVFTGQGAQ